MPALFAIAIAFAILAAAGGDLTLPGLEANRRVWPLLVLFLLQGVARGRLLESIDAGGLSVLIWAALATALIIVCWWAAATPGVGLIAAGTAANVLVVLLNGGMPVLGGAPDSAFYHAAGPADILVGLGDVVPAPGGLMLSLGDVLMLIGAMTVVLRAGMQLPLADRRVVSR